MASGLGGSARLIVINGNLKVEQCDLAAQVPILLPFEEQHYPITYWAKLWGFSAKTIREWFSEETGMGILRQANTGRRLKRDYITLMISPTAAARVYERRTKLLS